MRGAGDLPLIVIGIASDAPGEIWSRALCQPLKSTVRDGTPEAFFNGVLFDCPGDLSKHPVNGFAVHLHDFVRMRECRIKQRAAQESAIEHALCVERAQGFRLRVIETEVRETGVSVARDDRRSVFFAAAFP